MPVDCSYAAELEVHTSRGDERPLAGDQTWQRQLMPRANRRSESIASACVRSLPAKFASAWRPDMCDRWHGWRWPASVHFPSNLAMCCHVRCSRPARSTSACATSGASPIGLPFEVATTLPITEPLVTGASRPDLGSTEVCTCWPRGTVNIHGAPSPAATVSALPKLTLVVVTTVFG